MPHVSRSIADEVYAYKEQMGAIRSAQHKKKLEKYGKRAAVIAGVVAVGVIGGACTPKTVKWYLTCSNFRRHRRGSILMAT